MKVQAMPRHRPGRAGSRTARRVPATEGGGGVGRLRIHAGRWGGRWIQTLPDRRVRPMLDRVREALFNALASRGWLDGAGVLDPFAGSGILGLEALSRGAAHATLIERDREVYARLVENVGQLGIEAERISLIHGDALREGARHVRPWLGADSAGAPLLVLLDPPYPELRPPRAESFVAQLDALLVHLAPHTSQNASRPPVLIVVGHEEAAALPATLAGWPCRETRRYARARLSFYGDWPE